MHHTTHRVKLIKAAPKRKAAGMLPTSTTAITKNHPQTVALHVRIQQAVMRLAAWLAVSVRGLQ